MTTDSKTIFTIGHSNHSLEKFLSIVKTNVIQIVVDIRSKPYSRFATQFNKTAIQGSLQSANISYVPLGDKLGGRPDDRRFYDEEGNVVYGRISETPEFLKGIESVVHLAGEHRIALMCSEEDPLKCHRYHLVSGFLEKKGVRVIHIRGDGRLQSSEDIKVETEAERKDPMQLKLF
jgi:uncharacterized protein (DUF488 family)